jgi:hypothetical protein
MIGLASGAGRKAMARSLELRRPLGFALVLALVVFLAWRKASPIDQTADRSDWNVLILTLDTTRADRLGAYGFAGADTPNIDRLEPARARCSSRRSGPRQWGDRLNDVAQEILINGRRTMRTRMRIDQTP